MEFTVLGCQSVFVCPLKLGVEIFLFIFYEILSLKKKKNVLNISREVAWE